MSYINKIKKDETTYDIQDARLEVTVADAGKVVSVDDEGNLTLKEMSGGTKLYKHTFMVSYATFNLISNSSSPITSLLELRNAYQTAISIDTTSRNLINVGWNGGGDEVVSIAFTLASTSSTAVVGNVLTLETIGENFDTITEL